MVSSLGVFLTKMQDIVFKNPVFDFYRTLLNFYGTQNWWPGESTLEILTGAILTQNTSWLNVEKAITKLKNASLLNLKSLYSVDICLLAELIKPSGFYRIKSYRIKNLVKYIYDIYDGDMDKMALKDSLSLRKELLAVNGVGEETADAILLYGFNKPFFVVDKYTRRILSRHRLVTKKSNYQQVQKYIMGSIPSDVFIYNNFHAMLVLTGKRFCKTKPLCHNCPLNHFSETSSSLYD